MFAISQKTHVFSVAGSYGLSSIKSKTYQMFVDSYNEYAGLTNEISSPLENFSNAKTFDISIFIPFPYIKNSDIHFTYYYTKASSEVLFTTGNIRTFEYTRRGVGLGLDLSTVNRGLENKGWLTFSNSFFLGWQDITTDYQFIPGYSYHGSKFRSLNGQFYQSCLSFLTELTYSYKIKNVSIFLKGGINFPNFLNFQYHNLQRSNSVEYENITFLPTDYGAYQEDPDYDFKAIDDLDLQVSSRNWIYTISLGTAIHLVDKSRFKKLK